MKFFAMDIFRPLLKTLNVILFIVLITYGYSNELRAILTCRTATSHSAF